MRDLTGTTALLTGASSGLGPVVARRLRQEGVRLVLSARDRVKLAALAEELGDSTIVAADLAQRGEAERLAEAAGPVDLLLAVAGLPASGQLLDLDIEHVDHALDVNLRAAIVLVRELLPGMVERKRGHVLLMTSIAGQIPTPGTSIYNATKFGLRGFGHALRSELRGTGVGVSMVSPTFVSRAGMWADTGLRASVREVTPERVAETCIRAIREDRAEVTVAPVEQRIVSRLVLAFPGAFQRFLPTAAMPDEAIRRQVVKR